jgi:hypothetical protein
VTIASASLFVAAGGSVSLPIGVSGFDSDDNVTVNIVGLPVFETITDALDHRTFGGNSVTLTAAEVNSGLTLHSTYGGSGQPVNVLTVTAINTTAGEQARSPARTITVTDPPTSFVEPSIQPVNALPSPILTSPPGAGAPTWPVGSQSQTVGVGLKTLTLGAMGTNDSGNSLAVGGGRPAAVGKAAVRLSPQGVDTASTDRAELAAVAHTGATFVVASRLRVPGSDAMTSGAEAIGSVATQSVESAPIIIASVAAGPIGEPARISAMVGPAPSARELAAALFFAGVTVSPSAAGRDDARRTMKHPAKPRRQRIVTFDLADDRFDGPAGRIDVADLPPMIETNGEGVEWIVV